MKETRTHISVILDRTGSMESIRDDIIGGFNAFLDGQKQQPGGATLTLVQFDTQDPYEIIHDFRPIADVPDLTRETYVPRAMTPLLDAVGRGINDLETRLAKLPARKRPGKVVVVIVTDGQENSSREFKKNRIEKMIREHEEKDNWQFVFLSADLGAFQDAGDYGFNSIKTMLFNKSARGTARAWSSVSERVLEFRRGETAEVEFNRRDREKQEELSGPGDN